MELRIDTLLSNRAFDCRTYADMAGEEMFSKYQTLIYLAGSASAEFFADMALAPFEAIKVRILARELSVQSHQHDPLHMHVGLALCRTSVPWKGCLVQCPKWGKIVSAPLALFGPFTEHVSGSLTPCSLWDCASLQRVAAVPFKRLQLTFYLAEPLNSASRQSGRTHLQKAMLRNSMKPCCAIVLAAAGGCADAAWLCQGFDRWCTQAHQGRGHWSVSGTSGEIQGLGLKVQQKNRVNLQQGGRRNHRLGDNLRAINSDRRYWGGRHCMLESTSQSTLGLNSESGCRHGLALGWGASAETTVRV
jgi:hypothetical protein